MQSNTADPDQVGSGQKISGKRGFILAALCMAVLIVQLDTSVVNLAVHPVRASFAASSGAMQWVVDVYNLDRNGSRG